MFIRNLTRVSALAMAAAASNVAYAQDAADQPTPAEIETADDAEIMTIIVTGTNIRGVAPVGSTVQSVSIDDASGAVSSTAQLLLEVPQLYNLGFGEGSRQQPGGAGNNTFLTGINLRGLGPNATLTLMDGQRVVPMGVGGLAVDPSAIPTLMLQRIDIVPDGASAVYGSDAVAGVVNLISRRGLDGVDTQAKYGFADDYEDVLAGFAAGKSWNSGQLTVGYEYNYHTSLSGSDRDFFTADQTSSGGPDTRLTTCNPGNLIIDGVVYPLPAGGVTQATASQLTPGAPNVCDPLSQMDLLPQVSRHSLAYTFDQDIGDNVHLFSQGFYWNRKTLFTDPPATALIRVDSTSPVFIAPPGHEDATTENVGYAFTNYPPNTQRGKGEAYNLAYGARVDLPADFQLEVSGLYGYSLDGTFYDGNLNTAALNAALAAGTFDPFSADPTIDPGIFNRGFDVSSKKEIESYRAKVDGPLFALPGGEVRMAAGYEHQKLRYETYQFFGPIPADGNYTTRDSGSSRTVDSAYLEALIPIFGYDNAVPGIQELVLDLAVRYDEYNGDVSANTTNPKVGVNWSPVDGLTVRGSYGTSFRTPNLIEVSGTTEAILLQSRYDPTCDCMVKAATYVGANPDLQPEEAETWSIGLDVAPALVPGLRASINYFNINYTGVVNFQVSNTALLAQEAEFAGTGVIVRNPSLEFLQSLDCPRSGGTCFQLPSGAPTPGLADVDVYIDGRNLNLGVIKTDGIDFQVNYSMPAAGGDLRLGFNGTYYLSYDVGVAPAAPTVDRLNEIFSPLRFRARGIARWKKGGFDVGTFVNFQNSYTNVVPAIPQQVSSYTTVDTHLGYSFEEGGFLEGVSLALDVTNLFDNDPPYANLPISPPPSSGGGGFDVTRTSPIGRMISFSVGKRF